MPHQLFPHPLQQIFHFSQFLIVLLLSSPVLPSDFLAHSQRQTASWLASQGDYRHNEIWGMVVSQFSLQIQRCPPLRAWIPCLHMPGHKGISEGQDTLALYPEFLPSLPQPHHQLPHETAQFTITSCKHSGSAYLPEEGAIDPCHPIYYYGLHLYKARFWHVPCLPVLAKGKNPQILETWYRPVFCFLKRHLRTKGPEAYPRSSTG